MMDYVTEAIPLAFFLVRRARTLRDKSIIINYLACNAARRIFPSLGMPVEILVRMKDVGFWFATGKSELSPYKEIFGERIYWRDPRFVAGHGNVVVDVGAHIGFYALQQGLEMRSGAVYAFEPNPDTFARLKKNIQVNGLDAVVVAGNAAIADHDGSVTLRIAEGSSEGNTIMRNGTVAAYEKEIAVPAHTLDTVVRSRGLEKIDILKIDAEGAEVEILNGGMSDAIARTAKIEIETHSPALREECENILTSRGFEVALRVPSGRNALGENTLVYFVRKSA